MTVSNRQWMKSTAPVKGVPGSPNVFSIRGTDRKGQGLDKYFADTDQLIQQIEKLGVSKGYLNKLFLKTQGMRIVYSFISSGLSLLQQNMIRIIQG